MATSTNLGLYLPTRDDYISVKRDISDNMEIIDEAVGANTSGVSNIDSGLAYVAVKVGNNWQMPSGKTAQVGDFVIVNGVFGHATAVLTGGSTNIVENTNWVAETNGGLNFLNTVIAAINNRLLFGGNVSTTVFNHGDADNRTYSEFIFALSATDSLGYDQYVLQFNHRSKSIQVFGRTPNNQYVFLYRTEEIIQNNENEYQKIVLINSGSVYHLHYERYIPVNSGTVVHNISSDYRPASSCTGCDYYMQTSGFGRVTCTVSTNGNVTLSGNDYNEPVAGIFDVYWTK